LNEAIAGDQRANLRPDGARVGASLHETDDRLAAGPGTSSSCYRRDGNVPKRHVTWAANVPKRRAIHQVARPKRHVTYWTNVPSVT
jgi:hypothetical protein